MSNNTHQLRRLMRTAHVLQKGDEEHRYTPYTKSSALKKAWWFESFREALSNGFARFIYFKKNGTARIALGTRSPSLIPIDKLPKGDMSDGSDTWEDSAKAIPYYDLEKNEWRSFSVLNFVCLDKVWRFNNTQN